MEKLYLACDLGKWVVCLLNLNTSFLILEKKKKNRENTDDPDDTDGCFEVYGGKNWGGGR